MNIFAVDRDPVVAADNLCDKHVVKMILESAQILSTVHHLHGNVSMYDRIYKPTHKHHPSVVWAAKSYENYYWLFYHLDELCFEYNLRYNKVHKTERDGIKTNLGISPLIIPITGQKQPVDIAMDESFKFFSPSLGSWEDVELLYRMYYVLDKSRFAVWKLGNEPIWFTKGKQCLSMILDARHANMSSKEVAVSLKENNQWQNLAQSVM